ncbi:MAG TPA: ECF-type riboflavin transporter substrate-binding protein [Lachnospiraceae bacterium]|nr:ECF-type riboflavin transporter substrate-binding protein [Lachnospiraceae bacterium]
METKKLFSFNTKTLVATALGAALFMVLGMFVKIPTGIPNTQIQTSYGVCSFFAALFGPIAGALMAFIGHALSDASQYGSVWWSWVIASAVSGFIYGLAFMKLKVSEGIFSGKDIAVFNIIQVIGNALAWIVIAPVLDIVIYAEPANLVFTQGVVAAISNAVSCAVIGTLLLLVYSKTRSKKGSLTKED